MSSAQFQLRPANDEHQGSEAFDHEAATESPAFALRQQAAERLAQHRARRKGSAARSAPTPIAVPANARAAGIAAKVAERYAHSQSYRAFLAAEAERAIHEAEAAAEVAVRTAKAVAEAQLDLLAELDQWSLTPPPLAEPHHHHAAEPAPTAAAPLAEAPSIQYSASVEESRAGLTVRLYNDIAPALHEPAQASTHTNALHETIDEEEGLALDQEIEFRQSPVFEAPAGPHIDIPANLLEFPRQLIAARRARPRIAEGPLRDEADHAPDSAQLRIFEVEPAQISTAPATEPVAPVWSSIMLDARPAERSMGAISERAADYFAAPSLEAQLDASPLLRDVAPIELRLMAGLVDGCLIFGGFLAFVTAFALAAEPLAGSAIAGPINLHNVTVQNAALGSAAAIAGLALVYQLLFFTFSNATPGMKYARISLCTFGDDNPTRSALRRRVFTLALSTCPLGLGLLWAWIDNDRLSWHDRFTRMYQRSY
jgi:uncharacterized RDD family membrane protein YckC